MNAFETLGLTPSATESEVRAAHRKLARRWHPDRFLAGPEREWAHDKMTEINSAFVECLASCQSERPESDLIASAKSAVERREWKSARRILMQATFRSAEWNYLFGCVMRGLGEMDKARMYLSVAARQEPGNARFRAALSAVTPTPIVKQFCRAGKRGFLTAARLFVNNIRL